MTAADSPSVLQRMAAVAPPAVVEVPLTAARAVKLAMTRGAERSIGLILTVDTVSEESKSFDPLLAGLSDDMILLWLDQGGEHAGVLAMDRELSAAIVEMRTTGRVRDKPGPDRRATAADIALAEPLFSALLNELSLTTDQTVLDGWTAGVRVRDRIPSVREIGLALPENVFRYMTVQVDLGAGDRKGNLWLALPDARVAASAPVVSGDTVDWALEMEETVMESPAVLEAILHRSKFPLSRLTDLHVGQVIPLPGCSVASIRLEALDGTFVGRGRIGQMGGNMAVRIEAPAASLMTDLEGHASHTDNMPEAMSLPDHNDGLASDVGGLDFAPDPSFGADPADQIAQAEEIPQQLDIATEDLPITDIDMGDFEMGDFPDLPSEAS